jgi:SAM-dependent methyltransferase
MKECSKSIPRRMNDNNFVRRYFVGSGVDIGGKPDPLNLYTEFFPAITDLKTWDWDDGDAELMAGVSDERYDFVHSSHCLEHLRNPATGLANWLRVLKPDGFLVVTVPDEDMYEQRVFPSTFNKDHKWTFTVYKETSWSPKSLNLIDIVRGLGPVADIEKIQVLNSTYRMSLPRFDQTVTPITESGIEFVIRKRTPEEIANGGRIFEARQPLPELRVHFNQYVDDVTRMKSGNAGRPPFQNEDELGVGD